MKLVNISGKKLIYAVDEKVVDENGKVGGNILVYDFDKKISVFFDIDTVYIMNGLIFVS